MTSKAGMLTHEQNNRHNNKKNKKNKTLLQEFCVLLSHSWPELGLVLAMKNRKAWN